MVAGFSRTMLRLDELLVLATTMDLGRDGTNAEVGDATIKATALATIFIPGLITVG